MNTPLACDGVGCLTSRKGLLGTPTEGSIVKQKGKRNSEEKTSAGADANMTREKTVGLLFLAVLFSLVFWNSYWFLSKFLLVFVIVYAGYITIKSRS
jgi:hypothetical protein